MDGETAYIAEASLKLLIFLPLISQMLGYNLGHYGQLGRPITLAFDHL